MKFNFCSKPLGSEPAHREAPAHTEGPQLGTPSQYTAFGFPKEVLKHQGIDARRGKVIKTCPQDLFVLKLLLQGGIFSLTGFQEKKSIAYFGPGKSQYKPRIAEACSDL